MREVNQKYIMPLSATMINMCPRVQPVRYRILVHMFKRMRGQNIK